MKIEQWFSIPIWKTNLEIDDDTVNECIRFCLDLSMQSEGRVKTNRGGWQSNDLFYKDFINTPLIKYFQNIENKLAGCMKDLDSKASLSFTNSWININRNKNENYAHTHPNSTLSGVFYLTDNNSSIIFTRNEDISTYFLETINSNNNTISSYNYVTYKPCKNDLIIFPSWLRHKVLPADSAARISVAFNTKIN